MYKYAICAVVKNESRYIQEWIAYHLLQGFEHFYIYDNMSTDDTLEKLQPFRDLGGITLYNVEQSPCQSYAYNSFLQHHKIDVEWCAFIDVDEFIFSTYMKAIGEDTFRLETFKESFESRLLMYSQFSSLNLNWLIFGAEESADTNDLVINRFKCAAQTLNSHTKAIVSVPHTISMGKNPHYFNVFGNTIDDLNFIYSKKFRGLTEPPDNRSILNNPENPGMYIAHYHTKSFEEYSERKLTKNDVNSGNSWDEVKVQRSFNGHNINELKNVWWGPSNWADDVVTTLEKINA